MTHAPDRSLFLENGPTLLAARDRRLRAASDIYRLLGTASATAGHDAPALKAAA